MKIHTAEFALSAPELGACPDWALPEFAFIGRSNVGKSSLINLLAANWRSSPRRPARPGSSIFS